MGYKKIYVREVEDSFDGQIHHAYGFRTDRLTRPVILGELVRVMRDHLGGINDRATLEEMLTFVRNESMRPEAERGAHDDCIMALAIAHYVRPQQSMHLDRPQPGGGAAWTPDMWEDWDRADGQERELLLRLWGRPGERRGG